MYLPQYHQWNDRSALFDLVQAYPLGTWVCHGDTGLTANHVPFLLDRTRGPHGTLLAHIARGNPVWQQLASAGDSVVMFMGPQAYITPQWYPGKAEHGKVVPTWNYVAAHAHGVARAIDDPRWLRDLLDRLTQAQEAHFPSPWRLQDAPARYIAQLMNAVVGIEITVDRWEGKRKASQDEAMPDRQGTVQGLQSLASTNPNTNTSAQAMAEVVRSCMDADGPVGSNPSPTA